MSKPFLFNTLSNVNILRAENAIKSDKLQPIEHNYKMSLSYQYYDEVQTIYKEFVKDSTLPSSYFIFGGNAGGMQVFGLYKSIDGKIYIIDSYMNEIKNVFIPDKNMDWFTDIIE